MKVVFRFLLLAGLTVTWASCLHVCSDNYCSRVECNNVTSCPNGYIQPNGDFCGCCDVCVTYLNENEPCWHLFLLGNSPPTSVCAPGFVCDEQSKVCAKEKKSTTQEPSS